MTKEDLRKEKNDRQERAGRVEHGQRGHKFISGEEFASDFKDLCHRVRYIQGRVNDISEKLEDSYHLLREIADSAESASDERNDSDWLDLYEGGEYD